MERHFPRWVGAVAGIGALLLTAGAVIALVRPSTLLGPADPVTRGVRVYGDYLFSRDLAVAVLLAVALAARARPALATLMALTGLIQVLDIAVDATTARWALIPGLLVFGAAFVLGAIRLTRPSGRSPHADQISPPAV